MLTTGHILHCRERMTRQWRPGLICHDLWMTQAIALVLTSGWRLKSASAPGMTKMMPVAAATASAGQLGGSCMICMLPRISASFACLMGSFWLGWSPLR